MKPPQVSCENHVALDSFIAWLVLQNLLFFYVGHAMWPCMCQIWWNQ